MSKYNIDNGKTAIVDKIKHYENTIKLKKLKQTTNDKRFLMKIIHACRQLKCMSPGPKHATKCLVWRKQWTKAVIS